MNQPDELTTFLLWFLSKPIGLLRADTGERAFTQHGSVLTLTLFRSPPFQVEMVIKLPGSEAWPGEHRHPNVDTYEVEWFNTVDLTKNGVVVNGPELQVPVKISETLFALANCVRLRPTDWHGANRVPHGVVLLSVQQWLNGVEPTSVGTDWEGEPATAGHAEILKERGNSAA